MNDKRKKIEMFKIFYGSDIQRNVQKGRKKKKCPT